MTDRIKAADTPVPHIPITRIVRAKGCWRPASLQHQSSPGPAPGRSNRHRGQSKGKRKEQTRGEQHSWQQTRRAEHAPGARQAPGMAIAPHGGRRRWFSATADGGENWLRGLPSSLGSPAAPGQGPCRVTGPPRLAILPVLASRITAGRRRDRKEPRVGSARGWRGHCALGHGPVFQPLRTRP